MPEFKDTVLEPEVVANAVVKQVLSGKGAQLVLPKELTYLRGVRGWPLWMQTGARDHAAGTLDLIEQIRDF